ncbi:MAG: hypothetical protein AAGD25_08915 [Cyanobacteria bacterium P01_F01_bin.150]
MFATFQRPTLAQSIAGSSFLNLFPKSLLTTSSTAVSAAVGFLAMGVMAALPSQAQESDMTGGDFNQSADPTFSAQIDAVQAINPSERLDPIGSPHPLPWNWVLDVQSLSMESAASQMFYYRSPALMSPDGAYATYARMQILRVADPQLSQVNSLLFLENMETGEIQFMTATSPEMRHILLKGADSQQPGMLSMLMPISWSEEGDRVLVRAFESIFSTDIAADYAIIWHQTPNQVEHVVPTNAEYSHAVLLGWSQTNPDEVLFEVGNLGDEIRPLMAMVEADDYYMVTADKPITYGQTAATFWNGPQTVAID